jgi:hypothetical protein
LDPVLASVVLKKGENDVIAMPWAEVISRTLQKMTPAYKLAFQNQEPVVKKGAVPSLGFALVNRAGNKKVRLLATRTLIISLANYRDILNYPPSFRKWRRSTPKN